MSIPVPPFNIACEFHSVKQSGFGGNAPPSGDDEVYLTISTPKNKWHTHCKRSALQPFFDAVNANLPTAIEFGRNEILKPKE